MFQSVKSRLALVLCLAWVPVSWALLDEYWDFWEWLGSLAIGWPAIVAAVYAGFWVMESPGFKPVSLPNMSAPVLPRWLGFVLIALMVFVIMGLPRVIF